jgi:amino acid transporter
VRPTTCIIQAAIGAAGAKYTLIGFLVLPVIWAIPEALVTAEYSTAFPEAIGSTAWVGAACGPFWAWMSACLALVSNTAGAAAFPVRMLQYLALQWPNLSEGWAKV